MAVTYATITGRITHPGSDTALPGLVTAVPLTKFAGVVIPGERLTQGVVSAPVDAAGNLPAAGLKVPVVAGSPMLWRLVFEPSSTIARPDTSGAALPPWPFYVGAITASTTVMALAATEPTAILADFPPSVLAQVLTARDQTVAVGNTNDTIIASRVNDPASATRSALSATYVLRTEVLLKAANYGFSPTNTSAANKTALDAATADAKALMQSSGVRSVVVEAGRGRYDVNPFVIPGGVSLYGLDQDSSQLVNGSTGGGVFARFGGSRGRLRGLTLDGRRAAQTVTGIATVQFSRANNPTAGGTNIAGGVVLTAAVAAGATSIAVNTASPAGEPIRPGEVVKLVEGGAEEIVRIARTYTLGSLTLPLESPVAAAFSTAAKASVAITDIDTSDCLVYGNGRDAIAFWHVIGGYADHNILRDFEDTGIDLPDAGSRNVKARFNDIETAGRWGIAFDTLDTASFGRVSDCESIGNTIRFLPGGAAFASGGAQDGVYLGITDRCKSVGDTVDVTLAGISGMRLAGTAALHVRNPQIVNPTVIGPTTPRAGTAGVRNTAGAANTLLRVQGGDLSGVARGVDADTIRQAIIMGTNVRNFTDFGFNFLGDAGSVQQISLLGIYAFGGVAGVRFGGTPKVGNAARTSGVVADGFSFAAITADAGWNHTGTGNIP